MKIFNSVASLQNILFIIGHIGSTIQGYDEYKDGPPLNNGIRLSGRESPASRNTSLYICMYGCAYEWVWR